MPEYVLENVELADGIGALAQLQSALNEVATISSLSFRDGVLTITTNVALTIQQQQDARIVVDTVRVSWLDIAAGAEQAFGDIPNWAHWTIQQGLTWHDGNIKTVIEQLQIDVLGITNLATALPVIQGMLDVIQVMAAEGRAEGWGVLALRNKVFPKLQNGE